MNYLIFKENQQQLLLKYVLPCFINDKNLLYYVIITREIIILIHSKKELLL